MKRKKLIADLAFAATLVGLLGGCGYTSESLYPVDVTTVDVPIWTVGKDVYRRELESRLTEAIKKRITMDTPYRIAKKGTADTQLIGTVERVTQRILSKNPNTGLPRELEMTLTVSFKWTDLRTGKVRASNPKLRVSGTYIPHEPFGEDFFQGSEDVINELARRIVEHLEKDW